VYVIVMIQPSHERIAAFAPRRSLGLALAAATLFLGACAGSTTPSSTLHQPLASASTTATSMPTALPTTATPIPPAAGSVVAIAQLVVPRAAHTATRLLDGRVLVAGGCSRQGCGGNDEAARSELFDPLTDTFSAGAAMTVPRAGHTATLLGDGRVLIIGGYEAEGRPPLASAEVYDPASGIFMPAGEMAQPRGSHTATPLDDGRVLVAGGVAGRGGVLDTVEIYDPATGQFLPAAPLPAPRAIHAAVRLGSGEVLVVGGRSLDDEAVIASSARYEPATDSWAEAGNLRQARYKHTVVGLSDGGALAIGGSDAADSQGRLASIERWYPATGAWTPAADMSVGRFKIEAAAAVLTDGRVLIAGDGVVPEVFNPDTGSLRRVDGSLATATMFATATTLADGRVLITGGYDQDIAPVADAYLYRP
jgi:hypothetical protein